MPELPEVETVRRGLAPFVEGAYIEKVTLNRPDLRFVFPDGFAEGLEGRAITTLGRRAKYLLFSLSDGATWLTHLGMTGGFSINDRALDEPSRFYEVRNDKHVHVTAALSHPRHGQLLLAYSDPRRFGFMGLYPQGATNPFIDDLGPEPLSNRLDAVWLASRLNGRKAPVKTALLDQRLIAGLGNIYVCEALHMAGIRPTRTAGSLAAAEIEALVAAIRTVLEAALAAGGSTLRDFRNAEGVPGYFQHSFAVYDREGDPCLKPGCTGTVARIVQSGRSSFFCPLCQH